MGLIFKEALDAANVILCSVLTETHYLATLVLTLILANKEKSEMSVFVQSFSLEWKKAYSQLNDGHGAFLSGLAWKISYIARLHRSSTESEALSVPPHVPFSYPEGLVLDQPAESAVAHTVQNPVSEPSSGFSCDLITSAAK